MSTLEGQIVYPSLPYTFSVAPYSYFKSLAEQHQIKKTLECCTIMVLREHTGTSIWYGKKLWGYLCHPFPGHAIPCLSSSMPKQPPKCMEVPNHWDYVCLSESLQRWWLGVLWSCTEPRYWILSVLSQHSLPNPWSGFQTANGTLSALPSPYDTDKTSK